MDFQLIDTEELCEARLYRASGGFRNMTGEQLADLLYLNILITYMLMQDNTQSVFAREFLKQTTRFSTFSLFRTHATDLYMLIYAVTTPNSDNLNLRDASKSKNFLRSLNLNVPQLRRFLKELENNNVTTNKAHNFLYRLETQLKIKDARYKKWRRLVLDWQNLKYPQKQLVVAQSVQEMRKLGHGSGSELIPSLTGMLKYRKYKDLAKEPAPVEKPSMVKRAAATAAGALAGRALANKLNGLDAKHAKNIGTGLGAIAGYWASGRQRK